MTRERMRAEGRKAAAAHVAADLVALASLFQGTLRYRSPLL
jgi:hypothetical protein